MNVTKKYFEDVNEGCVKKIVTEYCDCNGDTYCITTEEELPYVQKHEILPPVFISDTFGSQQYKKAKLSQDSYKKKGKTYIHVTNPLKVGDVIKVKGDYKAMYFLKSMKWKDKFNNFIFEIQRLDKNSIVYLDLNKLKKGITISVKGYLTENKK